MGMFGHVVLNVRKLAQEAEADERREAARIGRHRQPMTRAGILHEKAHNTSKHLVHIILLTGAGMPAILTFEALRPLWTKYIETPLTDVMIGSHPATEALHTHLSLLFLR